MQVQATRSTAPTPAAASPELQQRAQEVVDAWRKEAHVPGVTVAIRQGGRDVLELASGDAVQAPRDRLTTDARRASALRASDTMWAGSITKTLTAATALQLIEEGKLGFDDTLAKWIPSFPRGEQVTVRQLLTQTSGIPNITAQPDFLDRVVKEGPLAPDALVDEIGQLPGRVDPGSYAYSNSNYNLLGTIIEQVTGKPYADVVRERVIEPAGAERSARVDTGVGDSPVRAHEYLTFEDGTTVDQHPIYQPGRFWRSVTGASGGLATTASDLARLGEAILRPGGAALSDAMRGAMIQAARTSQNADAYGIGSYRDELHLRDGTHVAYGHNGAVVGASANLMYVPDTDQTIAVMVNTNTTDGSDLRERLLDLFAESELMGR